MRRADLAEAKPQHKNGYSSSLLLENEIGITYLDKETNVLVRLPDRALRHIELPTLMGISVGILFLSSSKCRACLLMTLVLQAVVVCT